MPRTISAEGLNHIKQWESLRLTAYRNFANEPWTIGYGHTSNAGPPKVTPGMRITADEAERILRADVAKFEARVVALVKVPLTDSQFAALVSFDYNTGALGNSTLLRRLNAGDYDAVPGELAKWVNADGKRVQGLVNRRASEIALWRSGGEAAPTDPVKLPVLRKGAKGADVGVLQTLLNAAGGSLTVDNDFGGRTLDAVLAFQRRAGLKADGVVGAKTWGALQ